MSKWEITRDDVQAPLAAPTYLTHVTVPKFRRGRAITAAIALHLAAVIALLIFLHEHFHPPSPNQASVALVMQSTANAGTGPEVITIVTPPPAPRPQRRSPAPPDQAPPLDAAPPPANGIQSGLDMATAQKRAALPPPARPHPRRPRLAPKPSPTPPAAPAPHLGDDQPEGFGLSRGATIIPAKPDADANRPPSYPRAALIHGQEGRVLLSIQVAPNGKPSMVSVVTSSGFQLLDNAARAAVRDWHFQPAVYGGHPVQSVLMMPIRFEIDQAGQ